MKFTVVNRRMDIGKVEIGGIGSASVVLAGDTEVITSYSYFDTPASSLLTGYPELLAGGMTPDGKLRKRTAGADDAYLDQNQAATPATSTIPKNK